MAVEAPTLESGDQYVASHAPKVAPSEESSDEDVPLGRSKVNGNGNGNGHGIGNGNGKRAGSSGSSEDDKPMVSILSLISVKSIVLPWDIGTDWGCSANTRRNGIEELFTWLTIIFSSRNRDNQMELRNVRGLLRVIAIQMRVPLQPQRLHHRQ